VAEPGKLIAQYDHVCGQCSYALGCDAPCATAMSSKRIRQKRKKVGVAQMA